MSILAAGFQGIYGSLSSIQLLIFLKLVAGQLSCSLPSVTLAQNQAMSSKAIKGTQTDTRII